MPNWCEGNIRFRGTAKNIKAFLMNEIVSCKHENGETVEENTIVHDDGNCLIISKREHGWLYIRNTRRNFFDDTIEVWFDEEEEANKEIIVCIDHFRVAWSFSQNEAWREIVKKYNFDVKMVGYERGFLFSQIITFFRDGREREEIHQYSSEEEWKWYCPEPNYGG